MKIYVCPVCGNVIFVMDGDVNRVKCCGSELILLKANDTDGAFEKHVPSVLEIGDKIKVSVGEVMHPMDDDHYINWVMIVHDGKYEIKSFNPGDNPVVEFDYYKDSIVYSYCNKHGLWMKEVE